MKAVAPGQRSTEPSPGSTMALSVSVKRVTQLPGTGERQVQLSFRGAEWRGDGKKMLGGG